jgi:hypothetical protein
MDWAMGILLIAAALAVIVLATALQSARAELRYRMKSNKEAFDELALEHDHVITARAEITRLQEDLGTRDAAASAARQGAAQWERKFWEMHSVVERVLLERDSWKAMFRTQAAEHLEGQAVLEQKLVQTRLHLWRCLQTVHRYQRDKDKECVLITAPEGLDPIDSRPVGQASAYYERMKALLVKEAPVAFDALMARAEIAEGVPKRDAPASDAAA